MRFSFKPEGQVPRMVKIWLITGLIMIFIQIVIGGITRLTGSGLSITRWEVVSGTLPPLSEAAWVEAFDLYKATPQYRLINAGMDLSQFKFIYFWEYFHRVWARLMFFVFIFPFGWFLWRGMFSRTIVPRLLVVVLLAGLEGFFGWIMVASGLIKRPWVNAYNLTLHLTMALIIFSYLMWTTLLAYKPNLPATKNRNWVRLSWVVSVLTFFQLALGAMMSGTKAGLFYPHWPDMGGKFVPAVLLDSSHWTLSSLTNYDSNPFMPALIQFLHRNTAYILTVLVLYLGGQLLREGKISLPIRNGVIFLWGVLGVQVTLGVVTLVNCVGHIPVILGVLHQAGAVFLLCAILYLTFHLNGKNQVG